MQEFQRIHFILRVLVQLDNPGSPNLNKYSTTEMILWNSFTHKVFVGGEEGGQRVVWTHQVLDKEPSDFHFLKGLGIPWAGKQLSRTRNFLESATSIKFTPETQLSEANYDCSQHLDGILAGLISAWLTHCKINLLNFNWLFWRKIFTGRWAPKGQVSKLNKHAVYQLVCVLITVTIFVGIQKTQNNFIFTTTCGKSNRE